MGNRTGRCAAILAVVTGIGTLGAECPPLDPAAPRTLILALDGVPHRAVRTAREMGAFAGWSDTLPLVSTFPSMTNVGFAAILEPFGAGPIPGYEIRYYDTEEDRVRGGGPFSLKFDWRERFQIQLDGFWSKAGLYVTPRTSLHKELRYVERWVLAAPDELMLALVSSTDALTHFGGDPAIASELMEISTRVEDLRRRHEELYGRPLHVVMLSDHGNSGSKIRRPDRLEASLRRAGLHPAEHLQDPADVIAPTYGVVGYGALYLDPRQARAAALAVLQHTGVFLAAWQVEPEALQLLTRDGEARVEWRDAPNGRWLAYRDERGDPLRLAATLEHMRRARAIDEHGFASRQAWFEWTALNEYPDAVARLVESLDGSWVGNSATVIFSFEPGYAWGLKPVEVAAWLRAGRLETTHGGLDRESTWGFFMTSHAELPLPRAVRAEEALRRWAGDPCTTASLLEFPSADRYDVHGGAP